MCQTNIWDEKQEYCGEANEQREFLHVSPQMVECGAFRMPIVGRSMAGLDWRRKGELAFEGGVEPPRSKVRVWVGGGGSQCAVGRCGRPG